MAIDVYTTVTQSIITALETGTAPWVKPWKGKASSGLPHNAVSKRPYSGTNVLLLFMAGGAKGYSSDGWLTYKQAQDAGGNVRKGEKGTQVVFAKQIVKTTHDDSGNEKEERIPLLRLFTVFNTEQCDNLPDSIVNMPVESVPTVQGLPRVDAFIRGLKATVTHGGDRAFYVPSRDYIRLPLMGDFRTPSDYYATAIHEHAHWTGHESRLNRNLRNRFGDESYAAEELIAEMTAAFTCARLGIEGKLQHAEYIASWLKVLKGDKKAIFTAASAASKAADWLFEHAGEFETVDDSTAKPDWAIEPIAEPVEPVKPVKGRKPKAKPVAPVAAYNRPFDYVSAELSADYRKSVRARLNSDAKANLSDGQSFATLVCQYSAMIMEQRGHDLSRLGPCYRESKKAVYWQNGTTELIHHLPAHVFGWNPTVTCEETLADGSVRRSELIGEGRKAKWVNTTRTTIKRPAAEPVAYPVAAE